MQTYSFYALSSLLVIVNFSLSMYCSVHNRIFQIINANRKGSSVNAEIKEKRKRTSVTLKLLKKKQNFIVIKR